MQEGDNIIIIFSKIRFTDKENKLITLNFDLILYQ